MTDTRYYAGLSNKIRSMYSSYFRTLLYSSILLLHMQIRVNIYDPTRIKLMIRLSMLP